MTVVVNGVLLFEQVRSAEVELIFDDGKLREGDGCIRRFWIMGWDRPFYVGHLPQSERADFVARVRKAAEETT